MPPRRRGVVREGPVEVGPIEAAGPAAAVVHRLDGWDCLSGEGHQFTSHVPEGPSVDPAQRIEVRMAPLDSRSPAR